MIDIKDLRVGDIFSESSHYVLKEIDKERSKLLHVESGNEVILTNNYISELLDSAGYYEYVTEVGKEDKKDGTFGIRSIFEGIHSSQVFTVCFTKQDVIKTSKVVAEELASQRKEAINIIEKSKKAKKSMADAYVEALTFIQSNPIKTITPGEDRILRGYKIQFESRDGKYNCVDMDIKEGSNIRPVNINTIKWIVINNVKYVVK